MIVRSAWPIASRTYFASTKTFSIDFCSRSWRCWPCERSWKHAGDVCECEMHWYVKHICRIMYRMLLFFVYKLRASVSVTITVSMPLNHCFVFIHLSMRVELLFYVVADFLIAASSKWLIKAIMCLVNAKHYSLIFLIAFCWVDWTKLSNFWHHFSITPVVSVICISLVIVLLNYNTCSKK